MLRFPVQMNFDISHKMFLLSIFVGVCSSVTAHHLDSRLSNGLALNVWRKLAAGSAIIEGTIERSDVVHKGGNISMISAYDVHSNRRIMEVSFDLHHNKAFLLLPTKDGFVTYKMRTPDLVSHEHRVVFTVEQDRVEVIIDCTRILGVAIDILKFDRHKTVKMIIGENTTDEAKIKHMSFEPMKSDSERCTDLQVLLDDPEVIHDTAEIVHIETSLENENYVLPISSEITSHKLSSRIGVVENEVLQWKDKLNGLEERLEVVENRQEFCEVNGTQLSVGDRLLAPSCIECKCLFGGRTNCKKMTCPNLKCKIRIKENTDCCERCTRHCVHNGQDYPHDAIVRPQDCEVCICNDGKMECSFQKPKSCPSLKCSVDRQYTPKNKCCPVCDEEDHCAKKPCDKYADCTNGKGQAVCKCRQGFYGNGTACSDIDECLWNQDARDQLGGCSIGTVCINLPGSFRCDCLAGHQRLDERNCLDIIRF